MPANAKNYPAADAIERRHEWQNPSASWVVLAAATVPLMMAACVLASWWILAAWTKTRPLDASIKIRGTVVAPGIEPLTRFPKPNLELSPPVDLAAVRSREDTQLDSYGWVDRETGAVRIPIDRALDLVAQRGLPFRAGDAPAKTGPSEQQLSEARSQTNQP